MIVSDERTFADEVRLFGSEFFCSVRLLLPGSNIEHNTSKDITGVPLGERFGRMTEEFFQVGGGKPSLFLS